MKNKTNLTQIVNTLCKNIEETVDKAIPIEEFTPKLRLIYTNIPKHSYSFSTQLINDSLKQYEPTDTVCARNLTTAIHKQAQIYLQKK